MFFSGCFPDGSRPKPGKPRIVPIEWRIACEAGPEPNGYPKAVRRDFCWVPRAGLGIDLRCKFFVEIDVRGGPGDPGGAPAADNPMKTGPGGALCRQLPGPSVVGLKAVWLDIFGPVFPGFAAETEPRDPPRSRGPAPHINLHEESAPRTDSKAMSRHPKNPARLPSGTQPATAGALVCGPWLAAIGASSAMFFRIYWSFWGRPLPL